MISYLKRQHCTLPYRILSAFIAFSFLGTAVLPPGSYAQVMPAPVLNLPVAGTMVQVSTGFTPARLIGITIHPDNPLKFDFIVNSGDAQLTADALKEESRKLIKYFLAALTTPEDELWVNLSPYEKDRMIPQGLGQTEMGRDMLAQDYLLKQLTASLMYPEKELGKKFWDKVYKKIREQYGSGPDAPLSSGGRGSDRALASVGVNTFNKVWVVPQEAVVYEKDASAFVVKSRLKVMLEQDYEASRYNQSDAGSRAQRQDSTEARDEAQKFDTRSSILDTRGVSSIENQGSSIETVIIKEVILPEIEKEVNEGENFATLRQMYNSLILAAWYKIKLKDGLLAKVYVDKNKTKGITIEDKEINRKIYDQYIESFKKGVYNYIKEDTDPATRDIVPRKYFSGGLGFGEGIIPMVANTLTVLGSSSPVHALAEFSRNIPHENNNRIEVRLDENPVTPDVFKTIEASVKSSSPVDLPGPFRGQVPRGLSIEFGDIHALIAASKLLQGQSPERALKQKIEEALDASKFTSEQKNRIYYVIRYLYALVEGMNNLAQTGMTSEKAAPYFLESINSALGRIQEVFPGLQVRAFLGPLEFSPINTEETPEKAEELIALVSSKEVLELFRSPEPLDVAIKFEASSPVEGSLENLSNIVDDSIVRLNGLKASKDQPTIDKITVLVGILKALSFDIADGLCSTKT